MTPLLTVRDVAQALRLSPGHVRRLVGQRRIPFRRIGRAIRFAQSDLEAWLDRQRVGTVAENLRRVQP